MVVKVRLANGRETWLDPSNPETIKAVENQFGSKVVLIDGKPTDKMVDLMANAHNKIVDLKDDLVKAKNRSDKEEIKRISTQIKSNQFAKKTIKNLTPSKAKRGAKLNTQDFKNLIGKRVIWYGDAENVTPITSISLPRDDYNYYKIYFEGGSEEGLSESELKDLATGKLVTPGSTDEDFDADAEFGNTTLQLETSIKAKQGTKTNEMTIDEKVEKYIDYYMNDDMSVIFDTIGLDMPEELEGDEYEETMELAREQAERVFTLNPDMMTNKFGDPFDFSLVEDDGKAKRGAKLNPYLSSKFAKPSNNVTIELIADEDEPEHLQYGVYDYKGELIEPGFEDINSATTWANEQGYDTDRKAKQGTKTGETLTPTLRKKLNKYINEAINIKTSNIKEVAITDEQLDKELRNKFGEFPMGLLIDLDGDNMFYLKFVDSINMFEVSASVFNNSHQKAKQGTKVSSAKNEPLYKLVDADNIAKSLGFKLDIPFGNLTKQGIIDLANTMSHYERMDNDEPEITDFKLAKKSIEMEGDFKVVRVASLGTNTGTNEVTFLWKDHSGRGEKPILLKESHIRKTWDLSDIDNDNETTLLEFLDNSEPGSVFENGTETLENIGVSMAFGGSTSNLNKEQQAKLKELEQKFREEEPGTPERMAILSEMHKVRGYKTGGKTDEALGEYIFKDSDQTMLKNAFLFSPRATQYDDFFVVELAHNGYDYMVDWMALDGSGEGSVGFYRTYQGALTRFNNIIKYIKKNWEIVSENYDVPYEPSDRNGEIIYDAPNVSAMLPKKAKHGALTSDEKWQIKNNKDRYLSRTLEGQLKWNESPDLGYTFTKDKANEIVENLKNSGIDNLTIVEYNKDWWKQAKHGIRFQPWLYAKRGYKTEDVLLQLNDNVKILNKPGTTYNGMYGKIIDINFDGPKAIYKVRFEKYAIPVKYSREDLMFIPSHIAKHGTKIDNSVQYIDYKGEEIMFEPIYKNYFVNDNEFQTLAEAKKYIDSGSPLSAEQVNLYRHGAMKHGGKTKPYPDLSRKEPMIVKDDLFSTFKAEKPTLIKEKKKKTDTGTLTNIIPQVELVRMGVEVLDNSFDRKVSDAEHSANIFYHVFPENKIAVQEFFYVLFTDRQNNVIAYYNLSKGGVAGTVVDIELICSIAVKLLAQGVVVGHNHPSGNLQPSQADIQMTKKIKEGLKTLDITLMDHIIVVPGQKNSVNKKYYSFANEGNI
jgi:DNA repair protein RadC